MNLVHLPETKDRTFLESSEDLAKHNMLPLAPEIRTPTGAFRVGVGGRDPTSAAVLFQRLNTIFIHPFIYSAGTACVLGCAGCRL